jgi:hypothetical protein
MFLTAESNWNKSGIKLVLHAQEINQNQNMLCKVYNRNFGYFWVT